MMAFSLTLENAELFFEICQELKADTEEKRLAILKAMAQYGHVQNIVSSKLSKDDYVKHLAKHFNVLNIQENSKHG